MVPVARVVQYTQTESIHLGLLTIQFTGSRLAKDLEKNTARRLLTLGRVANVDDSTRFDLNRTICLS